MRDREPGNRMNGCRREDPALISRGPSWNVRAGQSINVWLSGSGLSRFLRGSGFFAPTVEGSGRTAVWLWRAFVVGHIPCLVASVWSLSRSVAGPQALLYRQGLREEDVRGADPRTDHPLWPCQRRPVDDRACAWVAGPTHGWLALAADRRDPDDSDPLLQELPARP